nr:phosphotransferase [Leisingera sp. NJS204]
MSGLEETFLSLLGAEVARARPLHGGNLSEVQLLELRSRFKTLCDRLPDPLPAAPPTSLLHGNLRAANVLFRGSYAYLIDPGCY